MSLDVLDLFSGIGGFSLGLERAGMRTVAFCEIEPYCRAVLRKHWPGVPIFDDVRKLTAADVGAIDVICGGFPCQDISPAGGKSGIDGERSGLWREFARLIGDIRPRFVIVENSSALLGRGLARVLGDLAEVGFDAEWHCIPACAVGAPHERDRTWIVAYREGFGRRARGTGRPDPSGARQSESALQAVAHDDRGDRGTSGPREVESGPANIVRPRGQRLGADPWPTEPGVGRVVHGIPARVDRLRGLGNAVVPTIPEILGREIVRELNRGS
jgi:DNA (cytosine-5)-methyltransferase 1